MSRQSSSSRNLDQNEDRRIGSREELSPIEIKGLTSIDHMTQVARHGVIVEASMTGFLLHIRRTDLAPKALRETLSLQEIEGDRVYLTIREMGLEIGGTVARTRRMNKETYEVAIDFSKDAPEYWREALFDMLPR